MPSDSDVTGGGLAKFLYLLPEFPHSPYRFNILYLGSSSLPLDWKVQIRLARAKGAMVVWNQNGVAYPAWAGTDTGKINAYMAYGLHASDYVIYQSDFCRRSADRFLGGFAGGNTVLHNPVDVERFSPPKVDRKPGPLTVLVAGSIGSFSRFELAVRVFAHMSARLTDARLLIAGRLSWDPDSERAMNMAMDLSRELGISEKIDFRHGYSRTQAPGIFREGHVLLHTQIMDSCPCTVLEAMASGLPVVFVAGGGVPELVGDDAGIGIADESDYSVRKPPAVSMMADALVRVADNLELFARAARQRAQERFSKEIWVQRHREIFSGLLGESSARCPIRIDR